MKSIPVSENGLSLELLEELAVLAAEKTAAGGLRLMGEGGIFPELAQHLMQAALRRRWTCSWPMNQFAAARGHVRTAIRATDTG
ncbi:hypothetical protein [Streptomyces sp. NPDC051567]|uniref:hypothetical protein n=1 Tax=Streptomyces sp. NPDC051567 TaxID=3365660 RepID=UPI0037A560B3